MPAANHFPTINRLLLERLHYCLDPANSDHFRAQLNRAGLKRTIEAIRLTVLQAPESPAEAHVILEGMMWQLTPKKALSSRLRNPQANVARTIGQQLDARVMELVGDERQ